MGYAPLLGGAGGLVREAVCKLISTLFGTILAISGYNRNFDLLSKFTDDK